MLVKHLLGSSSCKRATEHPFLKSVGQRRVSKTLLAHNLAQTYIMASYAYPRFIAQLTTKLPLTTPARLTNDTGDGSGSTDQTFELGKKTLELFALATTNIVREAKFIEEVVQKNLGVKFEDFERASRIESMPLSTRLYIGDLVRTSSWGSFEEGLVLLWAVEKLFFDAWTYAKSTSSASPGAQVDQGVLETAPILLDHWTNPGFELFVTNLGNLVDALGLQPNSDAWKRAEMVFEGFTEVQEAFWPTEEKLGKT